MNNWISVNTRKPELDTEVLVFRQGYDITGVNYWSHTEIAELVIPPYDKRRKVFAINIKREEDGQVYSGFPLTGVTHWMLLPPPPRKINREANAKLAGYDYDKK